MNYMKTPPLDVLLRNIAQWRIQIAASLGDCYVVFVEIKEFEVAFHMIEELLRKGNKSSYGCSRLHAR